MAGLLIGGHGHARRLACGQQARPGRAGGRSQRSDEGEVGPPERAGTDKREVGR